MHRIATSLFAAILLAAMSPTPAALARDACFGIPSTFGGVLLVLKSFAPPGKNRCKPISGFTNIAGAILEGSACTTADGTTMRLGFSGHGFIPGLAPFQIACTIPLPSLSGGDCRGSYQVGNSHFGIDSPNVTLEWCSVAVP